MKKFFAGLAAAAVMLQSAAFAEMIPGTAADELTVSGTGNGSVTIVLLDADYMQTNGPDSNKTIEETEAAYNKKLDDGVKMTNSEIFYFGIVKAENGKWQITVPMKNIETKNLVMLSSNGEKDYVSYASVEYRKNIIPELKKSAALNDGNKALTDSLTEYIGFICDNAALYNELSSKVNAAKLANPGITALDQNSETAVNDLKNIVNKAVIAAGVSESKVTDFDKLSAFTAAEKTLADSITADGAAKVLAAISGKQYDSFEKFNEELFFNLSFYGFYYNKNKSGDNLSEFLTNYNKYLKLDLTSFNRLTQSGRARTAKNLSEKSVSGISQMQEYLNEEAAKNNSSVTPAGGGGGGGGIGSGSGGGVYTGSANTSVSQDNILEQKFIYSDMKDAAWAADAVLYLSKNNIVSGYSDNTFKPNANITRAEFTKLVVKAFVGDISFDFAGNFKDISQSDWYADVVNTAYKEGIVSGDDNGYFNPNDSISRQDMAVIVYNAGIKFKLFEKTESYKAFDDDNMISDYAKAAVYTLRSNSVINGIGDGLFAPLDNADRASAAQMIYSLITKFDK